MATFGLFFNKMDLFDRIKRYSKLEHYKPRSFWMRS